MSHKTYKGRQKKESAYTVDLLRWLIKILETKKSKAVSFRRLTVIIPYPSANDGVNFIYKSWTKQKTASKSVTFHF
jgi:hypothetical protein